MKFDIEHILLELESIKKYDTPEQGGNQTMLQTVPGNKEKNYGIGSSSSLHHTEKEFIEPVYKIPYINSIIEKLGLFRTRIMEMRPKSCYSYHIDQTNRVHIPIITNDKAFFVVDDIVQRMPNVGEVYFLETTKIHTAINASISDTRIHIVGLTHHKEKYW